MAKSPRIKHRAKIVLTNSKGQVVGLQQWGGSREQEFQDYGNGGHVYLHLPVIMKVGHIEKLIVTVEYLGEKQYKTSYAKRAKAMVKAEERSKQWKEEAAKQELARQEKELVQRRDRIVNQIELAFVKKISGAVNFITCDQCDGVATHLGLAYENPGSSVIDPDQITGAWCQEHHGSINKYNGIFYPGYRPYKTKANIECERLEFFYDGLRQLAVKAA